MSFVTNLTGCLGFHQRHGSRPHGSSNVGARGIGDKFLNWETERNIRFVIVSSLHIIFFALPPPRDGSRAIAVLAPECGLWMPAAGSEFGGPDSGTWMDMAATLGSYKLFDGGIGVH